MTGMLRIKAHPTHKPRPRTKGRAPTRTRMEGWIGDISGDMVAAVLLPPGSTDDLDRVVVTLPMTKMRPSHRKGLREGSYVTLTVHRSPRDSRNRFPLSLAAAGRWSAKEIADAQGEGLMLAQALSELVVGDVRGG